MMDEKLCETCKERFVPIDQSSCWGCRDNSLYEPDKTGKKVGSINKTIVLLPLGHEPARNLGLVRDPVDYMLWQAWRKRRERMKNEKANEPSQVQKRAIMLKSMIEMACITCGLNLTVYDGKIGFVDQESRRIVGLWSTRYTMPSGTELTCPECGMAAFDPMTVDGHCPHCGSVME